MNSSGFATISVILWTPFLLILVFSLSWVVWFLNESHAMENICHEGVLRTQEIIVQGNNQLMIINQQATWLYWEKKALNVIMAMGPPPVTAAAKAEKLIVIASQKALSAVQKSLFTMIRIRSLASMYELRVKMQKRHIRMKRFWNTSTPSFDQFYVFPKKSQLEVRYDDIAPVYKRKDRHWEAQRLKASWSVSIMAMVPNWLKSFVPVQRKWSGNCYSHPHSKQGGISWEAAIGKGNHSLRL